ncbi:MAG: BamA/TamA family outer membrane protein [bacterium]|nr:BamA/TamA family outer membrane protein [bacterium]
MKPVRFVATLAGLVATGLALSAADAVSAAEDPGAVARELLREPPRARPIAPREAPDFEGEQVLPPIPSAPTPRAPLQGDGDRPDAIVVVRNLRFEGNTALSDEAFDEVAAPWLDRPLTANDLEGLRDALTAVYVRAGYLTSGAVFPPQSLGSPAELIVQLVEGRLADVEVSGAERVDADYYASRIRRGLEGPLHVPTLEGRLRQLQRDPRLAGIHATIRPGEVRGETILDVAVEEKSVLSAAATVHNHLAPSLGEIRFGAAVMNRSLTRAGDSLLVGGDVSEAGGGIEVVYQRPLNASDTLAHAIGRYRRFDVSDGVGNDPLDVESEYWAAELGLYQPFRPDGVMGDWEFGVGLVGELAESEITFAPLGFDQPFALPGAPKGRTRLATLRLVADAVHRRPRQVVALRAVATVGLDAFGATRSDGDLPDARFWAWNAQIQAARRVTDYDIELIAGASAQLTSQRVFGLAQFAIGGPPSVRGYSQNRIVRDEGVVGGLEARIPIWRDAIDGRPIVQLVPFFDGGRAFSRHLSSDNLRAESLASVGLGLRARLGETLIGELHWGARLLQDGPRDDLRSLQDDGIHFRISATWP